jgi:hypothetical protein
MNISPRNINEQQNKDINSNGIKMQAPVMSEADFENADIKKLIWRNYLITEKPTEPPPLLSIGTIPVLIQENHSLIIGKKKSRKTLFIVWLVNEYLKQGGGIDHVLICDTEQGKMQVWKIRDKIFRMTGHYVNTLSLRGKSPEERRDIIKQAVEESTFKIVFIDGIRDLLKNINDPVECTDLITWCEALITTYNIHIVNILHQNKNDNNARGHLGTELLNKAYITFELELDEQAGCTTVKCESGRDIPFKTFAFTHNADELPEVVSLPVKGKVLTESDQKERLRYVFEDGPIKYRAVIENIMQQFKVGKTIAGQLLAEYTRKNLIMKSGKDHSPDTVYKLLFN